MAKSKGKEGEPKLTAKQNAFCEEYMVDFNATQAAIRAGYSEKTAGQIGEQNLKKLEIKEKIKSLQNERSERTQIKADRVLKEIADLALAKITDAVKDEVNGESITITIKQFSEMSERTKAAISEISQDKEGRVKIKMHAKSPELDKLMKHLGLYKEDHKQANNYNSMTPEEARKKLKELELDDQ